MPSFHTAVLSALSAVLMACTAAGPAGSSPDAGASPPPGPQLTQPVRCPNTPGFTCSTLRVPIDHARPGGPALDLAVAAADNTDAPRGVLLVLSGGPGQPGVSLVNRVKGYFDPAVLREYRMVMFDQRGTGKRAIDCADLQAAVGGSDFLFPPPDAVTSCAEQLGTNRGFYRTPDTVLDIDRLRQALGQQKLTLDGISYGTFTAAHYALRFPGQVRAVVLDSVVPHRGFDPFAADEMAATKRVLADTCAKDPACTTDPVADLAWLIRHGELDGRPIDGTKFVDALAIMSLSTINPSFAGIPAMLHAARSGDTAGLKEFFQQLTSVGTPAKDLSAGLHLATLCSDLRFPWGTSATPVAGRAAALDTAVRRLDPAKLYPYDVETARNVLMIQGCLHWLPARPSTYPALQRLVPPTLILHGTNDLFCPVEWARWTKSQSVRGTLVVVPGGGHGIQGSRTDPTGKTEVKSFLLG